MKTLTVIVVLLVLGTAWAEKYTSRYDKIDIDAILRNDRALNNYVKCILGKGPCTNEGREIKVHLTEALETSCEKCTDKQKEVIRKASKHLMAHRQKDWKEIIDKYDPERKYSETFRSFLNSND